MWRDGALVELRAAKQRTLLALLLLNRSGTGRDALIDALWGERPPAGARNTLQVYVSNLRRTLGHGAIETTPAGYRLHLEPDALDADCFERMLRSGREALAADNPAAAAEMLGEALGLWRGPALADFRYDAFAQAEAGRLEELRLVCREERIDAELTLGRHATLVGELEALVLEHPLRDRMRSQLILALYRSGRHPEALAQYQAARRMLADELGLEPSPDLRELERMILSHDPALAPPPRPAGKPPSNLPLQPTPFIGRERELDELVELIRRRSRRLVTLTGPGGSGKTRLAMEAATRLDGDYEHGIWWVPLQSLTDAKLVLPTITGALGETADIAVAIGAKEMLLVLDNLEQLLAARSDIAAIIAGCPNLQMLVTSREPLNVSAEREYRVPPMTEADAVALFDERAFESGSRETRAVVCRRVDCLPLAVELAAARTKVFTLEQILGRLDDQLSFLSGGPHDAPARQQTLRATIDWSYDLLKPEEQRLFERLGVFAGSWDMSGAAAVVEAQDRVDPLHEQVVSLIDKNLVARQTDTGHDARYAMLETIRSYALERLQQGGRLEAVQRRQASYLLAVLERATRVVRGEQLDVDDAAEDQLSYELPNLRGALTFALDGGEFELGLGLAAAGAWLWDRNGAMMEARAWMTRVLDATEHLQTSSRAGVLLTLGDCEFNLGDARASERRYEEARDLFERCGDRRGALHALIGLLELAQYANSPELHDLMTATRPLADEVGSDFDRARVMFAAATIENRAGDFARADALLEEGMQLLRNLGIPFRLWAWQLVNAGYMALERQDPARARRLLEEYLAATSAKPPLGTAIAHSALALAALQEHARDPAAQHLRDALILARGRGTKALVAECLYGTAAVAAIDGDLNRAARLWAAADGLKEETAIPISTPERFVIERYLEPLRTDLTETLLASAKADGPAVGLDAAIAYALGEAG